MGLLLLALGVTATCAPSPALASSGPDRVRAYFDAINAKDEAAIGRFLAPGATYANPQVPRMPLTEVMDMLLAEPRAERLNVVAIRADGQEVVVRTSTPSGTTASATVRLDGGCIRAFAQTA